MVYDRHRSLYFGHAVISIHIIYLFIYLLWLLSGIVKCQHMDAKSSCKWSAVDHLEIKHEERKSEVCKTNDNQILGHDLKKAWGWHACVSIRLHFDEKLLFAEIISEILFLGFTTLFNILGQGSSTFLVRGPIYIFHIILRAAVIADYKIIMDILNIIIGA